MSSLLQPGSALAHSRIQIEPDEPELAYIGECESCECDVADGSEVLIAGRLYHERCAERITDFGGRQ